MNYSKGGHHVVGKGFGGNLGGSEKYYGNGTVAVWSFVTGALQVRNNSNLFVSFFVSFFVPFVASVSRPLLLLHLPPIIFILFFPHYILSHSLYFPTSYRIIFLDFAVLSIGQ